jgi:hypothetical protein
VRRSHLMHSGYSLRNEKSLAKTSLRPVLEMK